MNGEEYDADLERRIGEDQAAERERTASKRRYRFAEVETLAKRLYAEILPASTAAPWNDARWAFDAAEEFFSERDRRKAKL